MKSIVLQDIREVVKAGVERDQLLNRIESSLNKNATEQEKKLRQREKEIDKLKAENRKYLQLLADDTISKKDYKEITEFNHNKLEKLELEILEAKRVFAQKSSHQEMMKRIARELEKVMEFGDLTEELLHRLVARIEIGKERQVVIHYQFIEP